LPRNPAGCLGFQVVSQAHAGLLAPQALRPG
jgi:hypothetical protein